MTVPAAFEGDIALTYRVCRYDRRFVYEVENELERMGLHVGHATIHRPVTRVLNPPPLKKLPKRVCLGEK